MKRLVYISCALLLLSFLVSCSSRADTGESGSGPMESESMPGVELSVSASNDAPEPSETIILEIDVSPHEDMQQAQLSLTVPKEANLAGDPVAWQGDLSQGNPEAIQAEVDIISWPLSEPIKVTLSNNISSFWVYWPEEAVQELPERQRGTPQANVDKGPLAGTEPMPSVAITLQAEPPDPEPGELTRFIARMTAASDYEQISGQFELPPDFQLEPGESLEWQGNLERGVEQSVELSARPTQQAAGTARFQLDTGQGEIIFGIYTFGPTELLEPRYRPEGITDEFEVEAPPTIKDEMGPPHKKMARVDRLPLVDLTMLEEAKTDDEAAFTVFIYANYDITNAHLSIVLPTFFAPLEGDLEWHGDLKANDLIPLELRVQRLSVEQGSLEVHFSADQGDVSPFIHQIVVPMEETAGSDAAAEPAALNLSGRFMYDENLTTSRGMYWTRVEVYDDDSGLEGGDDFVCYDTTDSNGYWSCSGTASDTFSNTVEIYARARAYNSNIGAVKESDGDEYRFKTSNHDMPESGGSYNFGTWWPGDQGGNPQDGAFHVHKMGTYANYTTRFVGGEIPPVDGEAHFMTFTWPDTDTDNSSEYSGWNVRIEGPGSTDPDEWDESVIIHEYGHYLMDHFAVLGSVNYCHPPTEPTPCSHSFNSHEDPVTAYIEGWANYYQSAVKRYMGLVDPHMYNETTWSFNIEASWHSPTITWDDAESTITGIFWDLNDSPDDDQNSDDVGDQVNLSHDEIHDTFSNNPGGYGTPVNIHEFYNSFKGRYAYDSSLMRIYYEHGINKDAASPSGSISINAGAVYANSTSVTLYLSASDPYPGTGVTQVRFANGGSSWSSWQSYSTAKSWTLPSNNGNRAVYVEYRDGAGNVSSTASDSIILDTAPPNSLASSPAESYLKNFTVSWESEDRISGVDSCDIQYREGPLGIWTVWLNDTTASSALFGPPAITGVERGETYYFRVRCRDNAGNQEAYTSALGGDTSTYIRYFKIYLPIIFGNWP